MDFPERRSSARVEALACANVDRSLRLHQGGALSVPSTYGLGIFLLLDRQVFHDVGCERNRGVGQVDFFFCFSSSMTQRAKSILGASSKVLEPITDICEVSAFRFIHPKTFLSF